MHVDKQKATMQETKLKQKDEHLIDTYKPIWCWRKHFIRHGVEFPLNIKKGWESLTELTYWEKETDFWFLNKFSIYMSSKFVLHD